MLTRCRLFAREKPMPQATGLPPAAALTRRRLPSG
nr:hypothetical protein [Citrobacter freundii]